MKYSSLSFTLLLTVGVLSAWAYEGWERANHWEHLHGGHRRQRSTRVHGNGIRFHHESADGNTVVSGSTATSVTTSTSSEPAGVVGTYEIEIPANTFYSSVSESAGESEVYRTVGSTVPIAEVGAASVVPVPFVRPQGELPYPPDRFGFENPPPARTDAIPNCGCVQKGACIAEVGAYTRQVIQFSDIVCGLQFQTCCFDGPWQGAHDAFANVAPCVAKEICLRPYGVLPTDVRDFGTIAPCAGQGAVRCIAVDSEGMLEFHAALAAIEAASFRSYQQGYQINPVHLVVPFLENRTQTTVEADAAATIDITTNAKPAPEANACESGRCAQQSQQPIIIQTPAAPVPVYTQQSSAPAAPNVFIIQVPAYQQTAAAVPVCRTCQPPTQDYPVPYPMPTVIDHKVPQPPPVVSTVVTEVSRPPAVTPVAPLPPLPAVPVVPAPPAVVPVPVVATQPGFAESRYGAWNAFNRAYLPYGDGFYGYPGVGAGVGFRKHISFSKGLGYGFGPYGK